jgi:hypothetical protein
MPAKNLKGIIMGRNRTGIDHEMKKEHPPLGTVFSLLNQWLCFTTLSRKNILWAAGHVQTLRSHADWAADVAAQEKLDRLDQAVAAAKERFQRREEKRARVKVAAAPKVDRRFKPAEALPTPSEDPMDIWLTMPTEKKT